MKPRGISFILLFFVLYPYTCMVWGEGVVVTVKTHSYNGEFAPKHAIAVWVMDVETDQYLSTFYLSTEAKQYEGDELKTYSLHSGGENDFHPVKPLTENHDQEIRASWDCITFYEQLVWDGTFVVWVEFSEESTFDPSGAYNGKSIFDTLVIDRNVGYFTKTAPDNDYFSDFTITYDKSINIKTHYFIKTKKNIIKYNSNTKILSIHSPDLTYKPLFLTVKNLKGQILNTLPFYTDRISWNIDNTQGRHLAPGVYILNLYSGDMKPGYSSIFILDQ